MMIINCNEVTTIVENQNINIEKPIDLKQTHWNKFKFHYFIIITLFIYFLLWLFIDLLGSETNKFIRFDLKKEHECNGCCILIIIIIPIILILINVGLTISLMKKKSKKAMILLIIFLSLFMLYCLCFFDIFLINEYKKIDEENYDYMQKTFTFLPNLNDDDDKKILIMKRIWISYMIISILTCGFGVFSLISLYKKLFKNNELNEKNNIDIIKNDDNEL